MIRSESKPLSTVLLSAVRGLAIGAADVVPGVSGGTMALVLGIYERLLRAISAFTRAPFRAALRAGRLGEAWRAVDGFFVLGIALGVGTSVVALAGLIEWALAEARPLVYALFLGLVAASIPIVGRLAAWRPSSFAAAAIAALAAAVIVGVLTPVETPDGVWFMVVSGMIGIAALLLPGVSGAFLLVLLGQYDTVIGAIADLDLLTLLPFGLGAVVGLFAFARWITALLRAYPDATHAAMAGFLAGSLLRVWPWQGEGVRLTLQAPPDAAGFLTACAFAALGVGLVWGLHAAGERRRR